MSTGDLRATHPSDRKLPQWLPNGGVLGKKAVFGWYHRIGTERRSARFNEPGTTSRLINDAVKVLSNAVNE